MIAGAVLMLSALLLFCHNRYEEYRAGQEAELLLDDIQAMIMEREDMADSAMLNSDMQKEEEISEKETVEEMASTELPVVVINGYGYIGYISIPSLGLELPVMSEWDYSRLKVAPCRQNGSTITDDLVIAAHNYRSHFGRLSGLETGTEVLFTDMDGNVNRYILQKLSTVKPDAVEEVLNSEYDLVLYTCTPGGATRVVVFCDRQE